MCKCSRHVRLIRKHMLIASKKKHAAIKKIQSAKCLYKYKPPPLKEDWGFKVKKSYPSPQTSPKMGVKEDCRLK